MARKRDRDRALTTRTEPPWIVRGTHDSPAYKQLLGLFERERLEAGYTDYDLFRRWLEVMWAFLNIPTKPQEFLTAMEQYSDHDKQVLDRISEAYVAAGEEIGWGDILGALFQEMKGGMGRARAGQFFTPWNIALFMAQMNCLSKEMLDDPHHKAECPSDCAVVHPILVSDPCCGSGVMFLAMAAAVAQQHGPEYVRRLAFYGQDIDQTCVLMAQVQLRINDLDGYMLAVRRAQQAAGVERLRQVWRAMAAVDLTGPASVEPTTRPTLFVPRDRAA